MDLRTKESQEKFFEDYRKREEEKTEEFLKRLIENGRTGIDFLGANWERIKKEMEEEIMDEKVLGFKEKYGISWIASEYIKIEKSKLVPVVSLEWLEKEIKNNDWVTVSFALKFLLEAAKEEAGKNG